MDYTAAVEAILYAAGDEGISLSDLAETLGLEKSAARQNVFTLEKRLNGDSKSGLTILQNDKQIKLATKAEFSEMLHRFSTGSAARYLSQAALEVLAIIAYQQPITRIEIDGVRGVNSSGAIQTLIARQLIEEAGRKEVPGRPILYQTNDYFLDYFGLKNLKQLPSLQQSDQSASEEAGDVSLFFDKFQSVLSDDNMGKNNNEKDR